MNVIITGANGFIGSNLVNKFIDNGDSVFAIVKDKLEDVSKIRRCQNIVYCSLSSLNSVLPFFAKVESPIVYHLAWAGVNGDSKADYNTQIANIKMACDVALFAKKINAKCFLSAGTIAEKALNSFPHLNSISGGQMYGVGKASCRLFLEALCKHINLPLVWMRFSNIYGPSNKTGNLISYALTQLKKNEPAFFGPANQPYDFIFIGDLIEAVFLLGKRRTHNYIDYFIGSGTPRVLKDYLLDIGSITGKPDLIKINARPDDGIRYSYDMFDNSKTIKEIGEYVSKTFEDGLQYTIQNF